MNYYENATAELLVAVNHKYPLKSVSDALIRGADPNARDENGKTPLILLCEQAADFMTAWTLVNAGADINAQDNEGRTAFMLLRAKQAIEEKRATEAANESERIAHDAEAKAIAITIHGLSKQTKIEEALTNKAGFTAAQIFEDPNRLGDEALLGHIKEHWSAISFITQQRTGTDSGSKTR